MYSSGNPPPPPPKPLVPSTTQSRSYDAPPTVPPHPGRSTSQAEWHTSQPPVPPRPQSRAYDQQPGQEIASGYQEIQPPSQSQSQYIQPPPLIEPGWVPQILLDKSKTDLEGILQDQTLLTALLNSPRTAHPLLANSEASLQPLLASNIALAQQLQHQLSTVEVQRAHTAQHLLSVRALEQQWKKKQAELERKLEPWGARELHQRLGAAIVDGEAVCKGLEESFLDGDGHAQASERETAEWVRRVRDARKVVALRRERKTRWDEGRVGGWR